MRWNQGQSTLEYAFLLAIIVAAIITVQVYVRRGLVGRVKDTADQQLGAQFDPYRTTGKVQHVAGGSTQDVLKESGRSESHLLAATQKDSYVTDEKVGAFVKDESVWKTK